MLSCGSQDVRLCWFSKLDVLAGGGGGGAGVGLSLKCMSLKFLVPDVGFEPFSSQGEALIWSSLSLVFPCAVGRVYFVPYLVKFCASLSYLL